MAELRTPVDDTRDSILMLKEIKGDLEKMIRKLDEVIEMLEAVLRAWEEGW